MQETSVNHFRQHLKEKVDQCVENHEILKVRRRNGEDFVVIGVDDWEAIEETAYLNSIPGLAQSIQDAAAEPLSKGTKLKDLEW